MKVTINVTQEDIKQGCSGNARNCPVARAIVRALNLTLGRVSVSNNLFIYMKDDVHHLGAMRTPDSVLQFIARFDTGCAVEPFSFELEIPDTVPQIPVPAEMVAKVREEVAK